MDDFEQTFQPAGPAIVFEDFDGDLVVLDLSRGRYFGFNAPGRLVWEALMAGASPARCAAAAPQPGTVHAFVGKLVEHGLIVAGDARGADPDPAVARALATPGTAPEVEVFDDLADLIVADPIHDTDTAQGWPVNATNG